jgi:hypothetical protein
MPAGLSLNWELVKSHDEHIQVVWHLHERTPLSAIPHAKPGQSTPSAVQAMLLLVPLHSAPVAAVPPLPVPAALDDVPAVLDDVPAALDDVPALLPPVELLPETLLVVPDVLAVLPVLPVPPSPSSGVLALEQPNAPEIRRNPTDAIPAYTLIMIASLFATVAIAITSFTKSEGDHRRERDEVLVRLGD